MLSRLNPKNGRMAVVISDSFLFEGSNNSLRKHIVDFDILEAIIKLPKGAFIPYTNIHTSLIVLNYNKPTLRQKKVLFINAEESVEFKFRKRELEVEEKDVNLLVNDVVKIYNEELKESTLFKHRLVSSKTIEDSDFDLTVKRHTSNVSKLLKEYEKYENLGELGEVLVASKTTILQEKIKYKIVNVSNLSNDGADYILDLNQLSYAYPEKHFKIINKSCLLITRLGNKIKPTYFSFNGEEIAINSNINAFAVDAKKITVEYLVNQLQSEIFINQISTNF